MALAVVALVMLAESVVRVFEPHTIQFDQAILVALLGLAVNLVSALLLKNHHHHSHDHAHHDHYDDHNHADHDHNLRAAYLHVLADAMTSVLAIAALLGGKYFGLNWLDPLMGIVGTLIISHWAIGLVKQSAPVLLDASINDKQRTAIRQTIEQDGDNQVADIHIWKVSGNDYAAIISLVTHQPRHTDHYKALLSDFRQLAHITIEVNECRMPECPVNRPQH